MARPKKEGIEYFSHDVDASSDKKLEPIIYLYGGMGYAFFFIHLEYIYRETDFKLDVSASEIGEETRQILCRKLQIDMQKYNEILEKCVRMKLFDEEIYRQEGKLTSEGVLKRAGKVLDKRKKMAEKYMKKVSDPVSAAETSPETPQSIVKHSKEKNNNPPTPLSAKERLGTMVADSGLSDKAKQALTSWLAYKKYAYTDEGIKSLLAIVTKKVQVYGEAAVCDLIEECMSNTWKGIIWDKLDERGKRPKMPTKQNSYPSGEDLNAYFNQLTEEDM